jgi:hypothetical protein
LLWLPSSQGVRLQNGKSYLEFYAKYTSCHAGIKRCSLNHICDRIMPNFECKRFHKIAYVFETVHQKVGKLKAMKTH